MADDNTFDLSAASAGALADINAANTAPPAAPALSAQDAQAAVAATGATAEDTPPATGTDTQQPPAPATPPQTDTPPAQKWSFTRKGQQVEVSDPEKIAEYIRQGYDYTQKTMELAEARRAMEHQFRNIVTNRDLLRAQLAYLESQQQAQAPATPPAAPQAPHGDPDEFLTRQQAQHAMQTMLAQARQQVEQETQALLQKKLHEAETARYTEEYKAQVRTTVAALVDKHPILKTIEKVDKLILDDVSERVAARIAMDPTDVVSIDDVKGFLAAAAERRATALSAQIAEHKKMEAVRAAKLAKQGAEPAGGAPPPVQPSTKHKLGSKELTQTVIDDIRKLMSAP